MKKYIKQLIKEIIKLDENKQCFDKYGKYLFGEWKPFYKKEIEQNTNIEKNIFEDILNFIRGEYIGKNKDKILLNTFLQLKQCTSDYPEVLKAKNDTYYRGDKTLVLSLMDKKYKEITYNNIDYLVYNHIYEPISKIQSWTTKFKHAIDFANEISNNTNKYIGCIYQTKLNSNDIIFNNTFLNSIATNITFTNKKLGHIEDEVIRIGGNIKCKIYVEKHKFNRRIEDIMFGNY